jgi:hypothetical protein
MFRPRRIAVLGAALTVLVPATAQARPKVPPVVIQVSADAPCQNPVKAPSLRGLSRRDAQRQTHDHQTLARLTSAICAKVQANPDTDVTVELGRFVRVLDHLNLLQSHRSKSAVPAPVRVDVVYAAAFSEASPGWDSQPIVCSAPVTTTSDQAVASGETVDPPT